MDHIIWIISYGSYNIESYGSYNMYFPMKALSNYQTGERAKDKHNGLSAFCGLNC